MINTLGHLNVRRYEECSTLIKWLNPGPGDFILDIGCGDGYHDSIIAQSGAKVVGIDIDQKKLSMAQALYSDSKNEFYYMNGESLKIDEKTFNKVVSFCVMEHTQQDLKVMHNIARALKDGGRLVFSADSLSNPEITDDERLHHQQRYAVKTFYTAENIKQKLKLAGFEIEKSQYVMNSPFDLAISRLSWKLDCFPNKLAFIKVFGYFSLFILWKIGTIFQRKIYDQSPSGLTILVSAVKR